MLTRNGNTMTATKTASAEIDFNDIIDCAEVVYDDMCEAPWDSCDGYEHTVERASNDYERDMRGGVLGATGDALSQDGRLSIRLPAENGDGRRLPFEMVASPPALCR